MSHCSACAALSLKAQLQDGLHGVQKKAEADKDDKEGHTGLLAGFAHRWLAKARPDDTAAVEQETLGNRVDDAVGLIRGILEKWPVPRVRDGRAMQWRSDEEFARAVGHLPLCKHTKQYGTNGWKAARMSNAAMTG